MKKLLTLIYVVLAVLILGATVVSLFVFTPEYRDHILAGMRYGKIVDWQTRVVQCEPTWSDRLPVFKSGDTCFEYDHIVRTPPLYTNIENWSEQKVYYLNINHVGNHIRYSVTQADSLHHYMNKVFKYDLGSGNAISAQQYYLLVDAGIPVFE